MYNKLLSFSGAGTKIVSHCVHAEHLMRDYRPDIIAGISSGSLVIFPSLLGKFDELKEFSTSLSLEDIFYKVPVNSEGKLKLLSIWRLFRTGSFGVMDGPTGIRATIKKFVSEEEFNQVLKSGVKIYVGVNNITQGKFELIFLNNKTYEEAITWLIASSSIPLYVPAVKIGSFYYNDGGVRCFNPAAPVMRLYKNLIKECVSVYATEPEVYSKPDNKFDGTSMGRNLSKTFEAIQDSIADMNVQSEIDLAEAYGIKLTQKFSKKILKGVYDIDPARLKELQTVIESEYSNALT
jgi:predicted acylesterase/phospholipase RssA